MTLLGCDGIKVLNKDQQEFYKQRFPQKPIFKFPDFVASRYFESLESHQGDYLLSVGFPFELKGMDLLILAFRSIAARHPQIHLRIMGYCPAREMVRYRKLAGNEERIKFLAPGWIEDVGEQMRGCYALVNAARSEEMGRVMLEAMSCRKPIVTTRTNGANECVEDGKTGLLCNVADMEDLAKKLDLLLEAPVLAKLMGQAGYERLQRRFSEDNYKKGFTVMLQSVLQEG